MERDIVEILGVQIDRITRQEALERVGDWFRGQGQHVIVTPNPEFLMAARQDAEFRDILNRADLALPDGFGLKFAAWLQAARLARITGTDFAVDLARIAGECGKSMFLLGGREGVAEAAARTLAGRVPRLRIAGTFEGEGDSSGDGETIARVAHAKPDILLVAYGAPKQEKWIARNLARLPSVKVAMGVGGAFDYLAGRVPRAPRPLRAMGLEWLWRLFHHPWRAGRIITATIRFPIAVLVTLSRSRKL